MSFLDNLSEMLEFAKHVTPKISQSDALNAFLNYDGKARYCEKCNARLDEQDGFSCLEDTWICTECGHENEIELDD